MYIMLVPYRNLTVIICVSILGVVAAVAFKVAEKHPRSQPVLQVISEYQRQPLELDEKFFLHDLVDPDAGKTPLLISPSVQPQPQRQVPSDGITALAYVAGDLKSGTIYLERNSRVALPVASMSKLVTAFVATETLDLGDIIVIGLDDMDVPPDQSRIKSGERFTVKELLDALLLSSSNVAAEAFASYIDRSAFLELMSGYAWEIGMPTSFFADPSGVSPRNKASAVDLFALARYLYGSRPDILGLTRTSEVRLPTTTDHEARIFTSTHPLVSDQGFLGGKTGRTPQAGDTMLTVMEISGHPVGIIVLGSAYDVRAIDTKLLVERVRKMIGN